MKAIQIVTFVLFACVASIPAGFAQESSPPGGPVPVKVVAPRYPVLVNVKPKRTASVVIDVEVNNEGAVTEVKRAMGLPYMVGGARRAALLWRFNTSNQGGVRSARLVFVFHVLPKGSGEEPGTVYEPPYRVEVRSAWWEPKGGWEE